MTEDWLLGRFLAAKTLGGRRRRRALRWAVKRMVARSADERERAATPPDAAYHGGANSVYRAVLCAIDDVEPPRDEPPADPSLGESWRRGCEDAARHAAQMFEQITGSPPPT
jgi:hypothetical protein